MPRSSRNRSVAAAVCALLLLTGCVPYDGAPEVTGQSTPPPTVSGPGPSVTPEAAPRRYPEPLYCKDPSPGLPAPSDTAPQVADASVVGRTWAGMPVGQALLTTQAKQYVAYYDADRNLTVAQRSMDARGLPSSPWAFRRLDSKLGWDSHNAVTLAVDREGALHVAGNMHVDPLTYFRSAPGGDIQTLQRIATMVDPGTEDRVTYPAFLQSEDGALTFFYRNGDSTNGATYMNRYDERARRWVPVVEGSLVDGTASGAGHSAYVTKPVLGPDGYFHFVWVWRDTGDVATNSVLTYAKTKDFVTWFTADDVAIELPIRYLHGDVVDPVPENEGLVNGLHGVGFDARGRVVISYAKFDAERNMQLWAATPAGSGWAVHQLTRWSNPMMISGLGTIAIPMRVEAPRPAADGMIAVDYGCGGKSSTLTVDSAFRFVSQARRAPEFPIEVRKVTGGFPGLGMHAREDLALEYAEPPRRTYVLRWEALGANGDKPRDEWPVGGSELTVVRLE